MAVPYDRLPTLVMLRLGSVAWVEMGRCELYIDPTHPPVYRYPLIRGTPLLSRYTSDEQSLSEQTGYAEFEVQQFQHSGRNIPGLVPIHGADPTLLPNFQLRTNFAEHVRDQFDQLTGDVTREADHLRNRVRALEQQVRDLKAPVGTTNGRITRKGKRKIRLDTKSVHE